MENTYELAWYVVKHYEHLMTEAERSAQPHLFAGMRTTHGRSDIEGQIEAHEHRLVELPSAIARGVQWCHFRAQ